MTAPASALDLLPTIAGFARTQLPANPLDGVDIGPVLTGQAADVAHPLFLYFSGTSLQCARMGVWKLHMVRPNVPAYLPTPAVGFYNLPLLNPELYNIDADPDESIDVSGQNPAVVAEIQQRVLQMLPFLPLQVQTDWTNTQSTPAYPNEPGSYPSPILPGSR